MSDLKEIQTLQEELAELRVFKAGILENAPKCGACAEGLFCGSISKEHDKECPWFGTDRVTITQVGGSEPDVPSVSFEPINTVSIFPARDRCNVSPEVVITDDGHEIRCPKCGRSKKATTYRNAFTEWTEEVSK